MARKEQAVELLRKGHNPDAIAYMMGISPYSVISYSQQELGAVLGADEPGRQEAVNGMLRLEVQAIAHGAPTHVTSLWEALLATVYFRLVGP